MIAKLGIFRETDNIFPNYLSEIIDLPHLLRLVRLVRLIEKRDHFIEVVRKEDALLQLASDEALLFQMGEKGFQFIPKPLHAVHDDLLVMIGERALSCYSEHLIEGSDAARESHEHIAVGSHELLAFRKGVAKQPLMVNGVGMLILQQPCGHHADHTSAIFCHGMGDTVHQPEVGASVD